MKSHEIRMAIGAVRRVRAKTSSRSIQAGGSDSAALDNVFEVLVRAGRDAPMAKALMMPAWSASDATMPQAHRAMYAIATR